MRTGVRRLTLLIATLWLLSLPSQAAAQAEPSRHPQSIFKVDDATLSTQSSMPATPPQKTRQRDSLKNGLVIGAIAGAAAFGTFAGILCKAQQEPGGRSCVSDVPDCGDRGGDRRWRRPRHAALDRQSGVKVRIAVRF
jgi:hypothetical protein